MPEQTNLHGSAEATTEATPWAGASSRRPAVSDTMGASGPPAVSSSAGGAPPPTATGSSGTPRLADRLLSAAHASSIFGHWTEPHREGTAQGTSGIAANHPAAVHSQPAQRGGPGPDWQRSLVSQLRHGKEEVGGAIGHGIASVTKTVGGWITEVSAIIAALGHPDGIVKTAVPARGAAPTLPVGTVVRVTGFNMSGELRVHAYSNIMKDAVIPVASFQPEPGLVHVIDSGTNVDHGPQQNVVYQKYSTPLWNKDTGPRASDAYTQGEIGDCYFMAAMAAVCQANPNAIKRLFSPQSPSSQYTVTLYTKTGTTFTPTPQTVTNWLPTYADTNHQQIYGNNAQMPSAQNTPKPGHPVAAHRPLWVGFLEKAWAQHKGSYQNAVGGWGDDAMEALTGVASQRTDTAGNDQKGGGLLDKFRQYQREHRAVTVGTRADPAMSSHGWTTGKFHANGNTFSAQLDPGLAFKSVSIADVNSSKKFRGSDDGNRAIDQTGGEAKLTSGSVNYQTGLVTLSFDAAAKPDAANLQVSWKCAGADYQTYGLHGTHEYHFVSVHEPNAVSLRNPWGFEHPKSAVPIPVLSRVADEISNNEVPGAKAPAHPTGGHPGAGRH